MNTKFSIGQIVCIIVANNFPTPMRIVQISASTKMYTLKFIEGERKGGGTRLRENRIFATEKEAIDFINQKHKKDSYLGI